MNEKYVLNWMVMSGFSNGCKYIYLGTKNHVT
jgi:hypothetical protein